MTHVTPASIAYIATQVRHRISSCLLMQTHPDVMSQARFALTSSAVFSRTDTVTDSERFYKSVIDYFDDIDERKEVDDLLLWWNK
jgi:hypothetical protein